MGRFTTAALGTQEDRFGEGDVPGTGQAQPCSEHGRVDAARFGDDPPRCRGPGFDVGEILA